MKINDIIKQRRSIGKMTEQMPTREQINQLIEAATHAPDHHKVEPWRFYVLAGTARNALGDIMAQSQASRMQDTTDPKASAVIEKERSKPLRAPVLIVVTAEHATQANIVEIENIEAVAAAVQNMLLSAEELGLACIWRTGAPAYDPAVKQWLGVPVEDHIVAILYLGYPAIPSQERQPQNSAEKTTWLGWEEI